MRTDLTTLRAEVAMRDEDHRIAVKHTEEAAARPKTLENIRAYRRAVRWELRCLERAIVARNNLLRIVAVAS